MCDSPEEYQLGKAPDHRLEITKHITHVEQFWHRARHLMYLKKDSFVSTNNITSFLLGYLDEVELAARVFPNPFVS